MFKNIKRCKTLDPTKDKYGNKLEGLNGFPPVRREIPLEEEESLFLDIFKAVSQPRDDLNSLEQEEQTNIYHEFLIWKLFSKRVSSDHVPTLEPFITSEEATEFVKFKNYLINQNKINMFHHFHKQLVDLRESGRMQD